jgi:hypothetical protein
MFKIAVVIAHDLNCILYFPGLAQSFMFFLIFNLWAIQIYHCKKFISL